MMHELGHAGWRFAGLRRIATDGGNRAAGQLEFSTRGDSFAAPIHHPVATIQSAGQRAVAYTRKFSTDHGKELSALSVCVIRMNLARTGLNVATVVAGDPLPSATGVPQALPSI